MPAKETARVKTFRGRKKAEMKGGSYEIEIKCLLGNRENAERLEAQMKKLDPTAQKDRLAQTAQSLF